MFINVMANLFLHYFTKMLADNMYPDGLTNSLMYYSWYISNCMVYNGKYSGVILVFVSLGQTLNDLTTKKCLLV